MNLMMAPQVCFLATFFLITSYFVGCIFLKEKKYLTSFWGVSFTRLVLTMMIHKYLVSLLLPCQYLCYIIWSLFIYRIGGRAAVGKTAHIRRYVRQTASGLWRGFRRITEWSMGLIHGPCIPLPQALWTSALILPSLPSSLQITNWYITVVGDSPISKDRE